MIELRKELLEKKRKVDTLIGPNFLDEVLRKFFHTSIIFVSSNFEEIDISWEEVEKVLEQYPEFRQTDGANRAILQARGQKIVLEFIEEFVARQRCLNIYVIKDMHRMMLKEVWPEIAGVYRMENVILKKSIFLPPHYSQVPQQMYILDQLIDWRQREIKKSDVWAILEFATQVHYELIRIHPFRDGNGRIARLVHNLICRSYGLPYIVIPKKTVEPRMWEAIQAADYGGLDKLLMLEGEILLESYETVLKHWAEKNS